MSCCVLVHFHAAFFHHHEAHCPSVSISMVKGLCLLMNLLHCRLPFMKDSNHSREAEKYTRRATYAAQRSLNYASDKRISYRTEAIVVNTMCSTTKLNVDWACMSQNTVGCES